MLNGNQASLNNVYSSNATLGLSLEVHVGNWFSAPPGCGGSALLRLPPRCALGPVQSQ